MTSSEAPEPLSHDALRFRIDGRVQGVGFRAWTRALARELGLSGHVRNTPDGWVEVVATGPAEAVERFRRELRSGPPRAQVTRITEEPHPPILLDDFQIR